MAYKKFKKFDTTPKVKKSTTLCHDCITPFKNKDLYLDLRDNNSYFVRICESCMKIARPKDYQKIIDSQKDDKPKKITKTSADPKTKTKAKRVATKRTTKKK